MINFIIKKSIKDYNNLHDNKVRERYSVLAGILGIICNLFLFLLKISIGAILGSIAIISDAFNNLSDTGSSLISIIGAKLSNKKPDKEHPFGHGRFEYISSLVVSFIIILVGFELLKSAFSKILSPTPIRLNLPMLVILSASVTVKIWMYSYNKFISKKIDSGVLRAAAKDSLNDVIATLAIIASTAISDFLKFPQLDGIIGIAVSLLIMKSGFEIARDTINILLGTLPDKQTVNSIREIISSDPHIVGVHDLIVHDYGPGRVMASVHAEVADDAQIIKIHEIIDALEKKVENDVGVHMVIHMDPISVDCERTNSIKNEVISVIKSIDSALNIHDFRMTDGVNNINLIFDLEVPSDFTNSEKLPALIDADLKKINPCYTSVINMDIVYE